MPGSLPKPNRASIPKPMRSPARPAWRPWFVISLLLHGLVLGLPLLPDPPEPPEDPQPRVSLSPPPAVYSRTPSPAAEPPSPEPEPQEPVAIAPPPSPSPVSQQPPITPSPSPSVIVSPSPQIASPTPEHTSTPDVPLSEETPPSAPGSNADPDPTEPTLPWSEFPHVDGAVEGCGDRTENCWQILDRTDFATIASERVDALEQEGYSVTALVTREEQQGYLLYRVSQNDETLYYLIVPTQASFDTGVSYRLAEERPSDEELRQLIQ